MKTSIEAKLDKLDGKANKRHYEIYSSNACNSQYHLNENCVPKILQFSMYNEDVITLIILVSGNNISKSKEYCIICISVIKKLNIFEMDKLTSW